MPPSGESFETREVDASPSPQSRTTSEFYEEVAQKTASFSDTQNALAEVQQRSDEVRAEIGEKELDKTNGSFIDRIKTSAEIAKLQREAGSLTGEKSSLIKDKMATENLARELYTGMPGENADRQSERESLARSIAPARLEELRKANEPLPGQEPSIRLVDMSPEELQQRRESVEATRADRLSRPVIKGVREAQMRRDKLERASVAEQSRYESEVRIAEAVASRVAERTEGLNVDALKIFSLDTINNPIEGAHPSDLESGVKELNDAYWKLNSELLNGTKPRTTENSDTLNWHKERIEAVTNFESEVIWKSMMFEVGNELLRKTGEKEISPEEFAKELIIIRERQEYEKSIGGFRNNQNRVLDTYNYYRGEGRYNPGAEKFVRSVSEFTAESQVAIGLFGRIPEYIRDIARYNSVDQLSSKDIPSIIALCTLQIMQEPYSKFGTTPENFIKGIALAINFAVNVNPSQGISGGKAFLEALKKLRTNANTTAMQGSLGHKIWDSLPERPRW